MESTIRRFGRIYSRGRTPPLVESHSAHFSSVHMEHARAMHAEQDTRKMVLYQGCANYGQRLSLPFFFPSCFFGYSLKMVRGLKCFPGYVNKYCKKRTRFVLSFCCEVNLTSRVAVVRCHGFRQRMNNLLKNLHLQTAQNIGFFSTGLVIERARTRQTSPGPSRNRTASFSCESPGREKPKEMRTGKKRGSFSSGPLEPAKQPSLSSASRPRPPSPPHLECPRARANEDAAVAGSPCDAARPLPPPARGAVGPRWEDAVRSLSASSVEFLLGRAAHVRAPCQHAARCRPAADRCKPRAPAATGRPAGPAPINALFHGVDTVHRALLFPLVPSLVET